MSRDNLYPVISGDIDIWQGIKKFASRAILNTVTCQPLVRQRDVTTSYQEDKLDKQSVAKLSKGGTRLCNPLLKQARKTDFHACTMMSYCTSGGDVT
jgi:hypothetical protein